MADFNWVDYIILVILLLSVVVGLTRGLVKEVVSLVTWVAAIIVASLFATPLALAFTGSAEGQSLVSSASNTLGASTSEQISMLSVGLSFIALFVGTMIVGSLVSFFITRAVQGQGVSFANLIFGGVFGFARGLLVVLMLVFLVQMTPLQQQPWWGQSQLVASFQPAATWLHGMVQPSLDSLKSKVNQGVQGIHLPSSL